MNCNNATKIFAPSFRKLAEWEPGVKSKLPPTLISNLISQHYFRACRRKAWTGERALDFRFRQVLFVLDVKIV